MVSDIHRREGIASGGRSQESASWLDTVFAMADQAAAEDGAAPGDFRSIVERNGRRFRTVGDMAYEVIREGILQGAFKPGERLRQDQLANAIGVSRIPVRSALLQLESEGLITFEPYRGAVVNSLSADDVRAIYEIRGLLEAHALRKAMGAITPERLKHIEELARELNEIADGEEFLARRGEFFAELYDAEHQPQIVAMIEKLRTDTGRYWIERKVDYVRRPGERDHLQLIEFLRAGDADGAVRWLQSHLEQVCAQVVALVERDEQPDG
jgi:DNA-binding GntR family transcriptional regulator